MSRRPGVPDWSAGGRYPGQPPYRIRGYCAYCKSPMPYKSDYFQCDKCGRLFHHEVCAGKFADWQNFKWVDGFKCPVCGGRIKEIFYRGCFIATAAYGSKDANEINIIRYWRDNSLSHHITGKLFIDFYYQISPPIAEYISKSELRKLIIRKILKPLIVVLKNKYKT